MLALTGTTLKRLQTSGRLFVVDHSDQKDLAKTEGKYGPACQAYFYIHPKSGDFLPLAIKPNNEGSSLIYTPKDTPTDWLFAKMMFNLNDIWQAQWYHFGATHVVADIVYEAAVRTLSNDHPVYALLKRREILLLHSSRNRTLTVLHSNTSNFCYPFFRYSRPYKCWWPGGPALSLGRQHSGGLYGCTL